MKSSFSLVVHYEFDLVGYYLAYAIDEFVIRSKSIPIEILITID